MSGHVVCVCAAVCVLACSRCTHLDLHLHLLHDLHRLHDNLLHNLRDLNDPLLVHNTLRTGDLDNLLLDHRHLDLNHLHAVRIYWYFPRPLGLRPEDLHRLDHLSNRHAVAAAARIVALLAALVDLLLQDLRFLLRSQARHLHGDLLHHWHKDLTQHLLHAAAAAAIGGGSATALMDVDHLHWNLQLIWISC